MQIDANEANPRIFHPRWWVKNRKVSHECDFPVLNEHERKQKSHTGVGFYYRGGLHYIYLKLNCLPPLVPVKQ